MVVARGAESRVLGLAVLAVVLCPALSGCGSDGGETSTVVSARNDGQVSTSGPTIWPAEDGGSQAGAVRSELAVGFVGDLVGTGEAEVGSAIKILRVLVGLDVPTPTDFWRWDCNQSGNRDIGDAISILRCVVGLDPWPIPPPASVPTEDLVGVNYACWDHALYASLTSESALADARAAGANCIALVVTWYIDGLTASDVYPDASRTPTDESLVAAISRAHALGMKVMLKPHVDPVNSAQSRTDIRPIDVPGWQASYAEFLRHYAEFAAANGVELLCVGTELKGLTGPEHDAFWRGLVNGVVKPVYPGSTCYAANHDEYAQVTFWDVLDCAGVDAYFSLPPGSCPTRAELRSRWAASIDALRTWQAGHGRPVLFTEIGYYAADGCVQNPSDPSHLVGTYNECCQQNAYAAVLEVLTAEPWQTGIFFWDWEPNAAHPAAQAIALTPQDKPAQDTMASYFTFGSLLAPDGTDTSLFGFERGCLRWVRQTYEGSRGVEDLRPTRDTHQAGSGALRLMCDLQPSGQRQGEAYVDLRYLGFGEPGQAFDLTGRRIACHVFCPPGSGGSVSAPSGLQILVKNGGDGALYGTWTNITEGVWQRLELTVSDQQPTGGYISPEFDPTAVALVGLKAGLNSEASGEGYHGPIYLDALNIEGIATGG